MSMIKIETDQLCFEVFFFTTYFLSVLIMERLKVRLGLPYGTMAWKNVFGGVWNRLSWEVIQKASKVCLVLKICFKLVLNPVMATRFEVNTFQIRSIEQIPLKFLYFSNKGARYISVNNQFVFISYLITKRFDALIDSVHLMLWAWNQLFFAAA